MLLCCALSILNYFTLTSTNSFDCDKRRQKRDISHLNLNRIVAFVAGAQIKATQQVEWWFEILIILLMLRPKSSPFIVPLYIRNGGALITVSFFVPFRLVLKKQDNLLCNLVPEKEDSFRLWFNLRLFLEFWSALKIKNINYVSNKNVVPTNVDPLSMQKNPACVPNDRKYFCEICVTQILCLRFHRKL